MREDLMSWQIEEEETENQGYTYRKNIYKEPKDGTELKREDAKPLYIPN